MSINRFRRQLFIVGVHFRTAGLQPPERAAKTAQLSQKDTKNSDSNITENVIERLHFHLDVKGLYVGPKNGIMNEKLNQAIQRFQASNRLSVDGKAVKNTLFK